MKKILFVGASGMVAELLLPNLSTKYSIVGIASNRKNLSTYCIEFIQADLLRESAIIFDDIFSRHEFDAVVWNAVRYFKTPLLEATRMTLHTEFDLAVALPLEGARFYVKAPKPSKKKFIAFASQSAFGYRTGLASYSIVKRAEIQLLDYLAKEIPSVTFTALAPGNVQNTDPTKLLNAVVHCIEETAPPFVRIEQDL